MPLAMAPAAPRISAMGFDIRCSYCNSPTPAGGLIARASTRCEIGHPVARGERLHARLSSERLQRLLVEAHHGPRNGPIRFHQKHGWHVRYAIRVAGRIVAIRRVEQRGKGDAELAVEFA